MPTPAQKLALEHQQVKTGLSPGLSNSWESCRTDCNPPSPLPCVSLSSTCKASPLGSRLRPSPCSGHLQVSASSLLLLQHQGLFVATKCNIFFLLFCPTVPCTSRSETSRGTAHFPPAVPWGRASSNIPLTVLVQQQLHPSQGNMAS